MMRIITGSAKGIRLKTLEGEATRPTAERVKEAVFSVIQMDIEGREVLDLFSGSGQMALEALSRGASHAVMLDNSAAAVSVITENASKTRLSDKCTIIKTNYLDYIKRNKGMKFDLVFLDPPYVSDYYKSALHGLVENELLKSTAIVVCESEDANIYGDDAALVDCFTVIKQTRYGRAVITMLTPKACEEGSI
jgi:16S rRNA (guanine(966)-N(2))-methyltransferase RsmD